MGSRTERMLLETIKEQEYEGLKVDMNTGYSHSGHDGGDIIVGRTIQAPPWEAFNTASRLYIIEEKYSTSESNKFIQLGTDKTESMIRFAENIGATPLVACRWSSRLEWSPGAEHRVTDIRNLEWKEDSETFSVSPESALEWETAERYFKHR